MGFTDSSSPLVVEKAKMVLVKPSQPTPEVSLSLSTLDNEPYLRVVTQTLWFFAPKPYLDDEANHDQTTLLQNALSDALVYFYPLAGKLHRRSSDNRPARPNVFCCLVQNKIKNKHMNGRFHLKCKTGDGVPFIRATAACTLGSLGDLDSSSEAAYQLVPSYNKVIGGEGYDRADPLAIQVTKFVCGGIIIGTVFSHSVCDGVGMTQFVRAMIELASGKTEPSVLPVWDRERLTFNGEIDEVVDFPEAHPPIKTSTGEMVREILNITSEDITKLKQTIEEKDEEDEALTTLEILGAHVWRARCRALNMSPDDPTVLVIIMNIRNIMEPPLPEGYYGNAIVSGCVNLTARELSDSSLSYIVRLIKDVKRRSLDKKYVLRELGRIEKNLEKKSSLVGIHAGFMVLSDWRRLGLHHDAFDNLVNVISLIPMTSPSACIFLPPTKEDPWMRGGVRVLVTLPKEVMVRFKEEINVFSNY